MIGARHWRGRRRFSRTADALILVVTRKYFPDGFTVTRTTGGWFDPARRKFVREESRQVTVAAPGPGSLRAWCGELAARLRQREVVVLELGRLRRFRPARARQSGDRP
jgi:hypothetical protein